MACKVDHSLIVRLPEDMTPEWLEKVLDKPIAQVTAVRIGTGQTSHTYLVTYHAAEDPTSPRDIIVKLASSDDAHREVTHTSGLYALETQFYASFGHLYRGTDLVPDCFLAAVDDEGYLTLVLQHVKASPGSNQYTGATYDEAKSALITLARLQAPLLGEWMKAAENPWLMKDHIFVDQSLYNKSVQPYIDLHRDTIKPEHSALLLWFKDHYKGWLDDKRPPLGLTHGDFRGDNLLFNPDTGKCTAVDWQTATWESAMRDIAYFMGSSLTVNDRRLYERKLFKIYIDELNARASVCFALDTAWLEYARQTLYGITLVVNCLTIVDQTERGLRMADLMIDRLATQALDLGVKCIVEESADGDIPRPLQATAADEAMHPVPGGAGSMWNESFYEDVVSNDGTIGFYVREGQLLNQNITSFMASITRPNKPTIMIIDTNAPLPKVSGFSHTIETSNLYYEHDVEPLKVFKMKLRAVGRSYADHSAMLRDEPGEGDVDIEVDLEWKATGEAHKWRLTPRYEIPNYVSGTITIDGESYPVSGSGQRDHSWGTRDWWSSEWTWSNLHFDDGMQLLTYAQLGDVAKRQSTGYLQRVGSKRIIELSSVEPTQEHDSKQMLVKAGMQIEPEGINLVIRPLADSPLVFVSVDGKRTHFLRTMCEVTRRDGVKGRGFIEWNRLVKSTLRAEP